MTDDLVKRLRDWFEYDEGKINDAREDAASRIEKLEAALSDIIVLSDDYSKAVPIARKALEGKDAL